MATTKPIPDGYHTVTPYLTVERVQLLLDFVTAAFGAEETYRMARPDGSVGHAEVRIGDSIVMMGEARDDWRPRPGALYLYVSDVDATYRRALEAGGRPLREPVTHPYGDRSGGVEDPLGNQWWIASRIEAPES